MNKVKIFTYATGNSFEALEDEVNEWLHKNPNIEVVSRNVATATGINELGSSYVNCTIAIFYKEA